MWIQPQSPTLRGLNLQLHQGIQDQSPLHMNLLPQGPPGPCAESIAQPPTMKAPPLWKSDITNLMCIKETRKGMRKNARHKTCSIACRWRRSMRNGSTKGRGIGMRRRNAGEQSSKECNEKALNSSASITKCSAELERCLIQS